MKKKPEEARPVVRRFSWKPAEGWKEKPSESVRRKIERIVAVQVSCHVLDSQLRVDASQDRRFYFTQQAQELGYHNMWVNFYYKDQQLEIVLQTPDDKFLTLENLPNGFKFQECGNRGAFSLNEKIIPQNLFGRHDFLHITDLGTSDVRHTQEERYFTP